MVPSYLYGQEVAWFCVGAPSYVSCELFTNNLRFTSLVVTEHTSLKRNLVLPPRIGWGLDLVPADRAV